jgi:maltose O-acetyltransferase
VIIGRNVWIGMNVNIIPGVTIGDGAIIGLATVVTNDVPARASVGGQAFRILGYRDEKEYEALDAAGAHFRLDEA